MSESTQNQYEFKVGDRVRCVDVYGCNNWAITLNMEYTVTWVETSAEYPGPMERRLLKVAESKEPDQMYFWSRFELIESKPQNQDQKCQNQN